MSAELLLRWLVKAGADRVIIYVLRHLWKELQALTTETDTDLDNRLLEIIRIAMFDDDADPEP